VFKYFETTALILFWSFILSLFWALGVFIVASRGGRQGHVLADPSRESQATSQGMSVISPALLVAPLLLISSFEVLKWNLLFPVHLTSSLGDLLRAAVAPALVLLLASGLLGHIYRQTKSDFFIWSQKPFVRTTLSYGGSPRRALRLIVVIGSLARSWSQSLPWIFGEMIVVECVFNAPGLGLDAWHQARIRNWPGLFESLFWLIMLYALAVVVSASFAKWLGRRLESYS
jgi:ABC-type dipeptide/oligopeptide/nickel transport system permease component